MRLVQNVNHSKIEWKFDWQLEASEKLFFLMTLERPDITSWDEVWNDSNPLNLVHKILILCQEKVEEGGVKEEEEEHSLQTVCEEHSNTACLKKKELWIIF